MSCIFLVSEIITVSRRCDNDSSIVIISYVDYSLCTSTETAATPTTVNDVSTCLSCTQNAVVTTIDSVRILLCTFDRHMLHFPTFTGHAEIVVGGSAGYTSYMSSMHSIRTTGRTYWIIVFHGNIPTNEIIHVAAAIIIHTVQITRVKLP